MQNKYWEYFIDSKVTESNRIMWLALRIIFQLQRSLQLTEDDERRVPTNAFFWLLRHLTANNKIIFWYLFRIREYLHIQIKQSICWKLAFYI